MQSFRPLLKAAAAAMLLVTLAAPAASFAHGDDHQCQQNRPADPEQRAQWARRHLDQEAAMLEIKASQQSAWDTYAAAATEMMTAFGDAKPLLPDADAATAMRQHAERAEAMAQKLAKLADATTSLQAVLTESQRKVLDRIVRMHAHFADGHHHGMEDHEHGHHGMAAGMPKPSAKAAAPEKPKN